MNLVRRQFIHDLRRLRISLSLWLAVILVQAALWWWDFHAVAAGQSPLSIVWKVITGLVIVKVLLLVGLIRALIHDGEKFAPERLCYLARGLFLFVAILLPLVLAPLVLFYAAGMHALDLLRIAPEIGLNWVVVSIWVALVAVVTRTRLEFIVWMFTGGLISALMLPAFGGFKMEIYRYLDWDGPILSWGTVTQLAWVWLLIAGMLAFGGGTLLVTYVFAPRPRRTAVLAAGLFFFVWGSFFLSMERFAYDAPWKSPEVGMISPETIEVRVDAQSVQTKDRKVLREHRYVVCRTFSIDTRMTSRDPAQALILRNVRSEFRNADGSVIEGRRDYSHAPFMGGNRPDVTSVFPGVTVQNGTGGSDWRARPQFLDLPVSEYEKWIDRSGTLTLEMTVDAYRYRKIFELPLQRGARYAEGSRAMKLENIGERERGTFLQVSGFREEMLFRDPVLDEPLRADFIYNARRNELYRASRHGGEYTERSRFAGIIEWFWTAIHPFRYLLVFRMPMSNPDVIPPSIAIPEEWRQDAVWVRLELEKVGTVTKTITVPEFRLIGK